MKWYKKIKNKLGILALFALMFQLVLPIYETYVYAEENVPETEQMAEEANNENPEETTEKPTEEDENKPETGTDVEGEENTEIDEEIKEQEPEGQESEDSENETIETEEKSDQPEQKAGKEEPEEENVEINEEPTSLSTVNLQAEENGSFLLELGSITDLKDNPFSEGHLLDLKDEFKLRLDWQLEDNHGYKQGDIVKFDLPEGLKFESEIPIELKDIAGLTVAEAVVKPSGEVEMIFTDFVETHSDVTGCMQIISKIDEDNAEVEDGEIILQPIGDEGIIKIPVDLEDREKKIEKEGAPNKVYNADEIHWEVTINKMKNNLKNATVKDKLPEDTEYKKGSLKVTKLNVGLSGNILGDLEEVEISGVSVEENKLNIPLGNIKDAYRIEYTTKVTSEEQKTFKNNVILSDDDLDDVSANATITINRGEPIKKSAVTSYNPKSGIIKWEIEFNYNQKNIDNITLKDAWTPKGKMDLVEESLEFQEVSINDEGKAENKGDPIDLPEGATLVNGEDQFEVKGISTGKAYKVTYQTKVKDRVLKDFEVSNTAGFGTESDGTRTNVGAYYGSKSAGNVDYSKKKIDWTIELNHDEYLMKQISIKDTLGDGLTLDKDSIKITVGGAEYKDGYTLTEENPFKLTFPEGFTTKEKIVIKYKTDFVADEVIKVNEEGEVTDRHAHNTMNVTWTPGDGGDSITKEVTAKTPLNKYTKDNSWKNGRYNPETKEITWTIYANYRENHIDNLIIEDKPQENQKIVEGSAVVTELEILPGGGMDDKETLDNVSTINNNSLTVTIENTRKAYKIQYRTSLKGIDDIKPKYTNQAEIKDGANLLSKVDATVGIKKTDTYGEKVGTQDGKIMNWSITVNPGQQKINNFKLFDEVSSNQEILTDTIKVYKAIVDTAGNATKGEEFEEVSIGGKDGAEEPSASSFEVNWDNEIERAFIVEYSTLFFAAHNDVISNTYQVTGNKTDEEVKKDEKKEHSIIKLGSGAASGTAGYLIVDKVDTTYNQEVKKMEGITFELIDSDSENVIKTGTTDENGQIDFGRLLFGKYELREVNVPDDYVTKKDNLSITIDKKYDANDKTTIYTHTVENYEPVFAIKLIKTGTGKKVLPGAEFTLFDSKDKEVAKVETDDDGKILFDDLGKEGTYYVKETKAPKGYVLNNKKHKVTVGEKQQKPTEIKIENKARGAVRLTKTDKDNGDALAGVDFVLQKKNSSGVYETLDTFKTDEKGQVTTSKTLEAGNYQFVEVEGLDGYRTNGTPIKFTVNVNSTKTQELTMENEQYKGSIRLIKEDAVTKDRLEGAEFKLVDASGDTIKTGLTTNNEGEMYVGEFFLGQYQLIETKAPTGYELDETPIDIEITEDEQVVEKTMTNNQLTDISVKKEWNSGGETTDSVTIKLLPTGEEVKLSNTNDWKADFINLRVYDDAGTKIDYEVVEQRVDGYKTTTIGDENSGYIITNTKLMNLSGTKTWMDDNDPERPDSITVQLVANGDVVPGRTADATKENDWVYTFEELPMYDADGKDITYDIEELEIEGYQVEKDGYNLTNTRTNKISVKGEKIWKDAGPKDRPESIDVILTRNVKGELDTEFEKELTVRPDSKEQWHYAFTELSEFNEEGIAYTYTVEEKTEPTGYESSVDGHNIINLRVGTVNLSGTKTWQDDNRENRPDSITVNLLRNQTVYKTKNITEADDWSYTFTDLPEFDKEGIAYDYRVSEEDVPGYTAEFAGMNIINTRSEKKSIEITKGWLDDDSIDRPKSINVDVYQNDELYKTVKVTASENWIYELEDLDAYDDKGQAYTYSIKEQAIEGYETTVDGFNLTNTRIGTLVVEGEKFWKDEGPTDRPESIDVTLTRELKGEVDESFTITQTVTPDSTGKWLYVFDELPAYDEQGVAYDYQVKEEAIPEGYETRIDGYDIMNLRVGTTQINVIKNWKNDTKANRPLSIEVDLLQNGKVFKSVTLSAAAGWKYTFTDLPAFDQAGKAYEYTIQEKAVEGYETSLEETNSGFELTNTYVTPETPIDSEEPDKSDKPTDPELPRTGEVSSLALYLIGGLLVVGGLFIGKKRTEG